MLKKFVVLLLASLFFLGIFPATAIDEVTENLGQIAIIGSDFNIYTYEVTDDELTQLTDDGQRSRRYQWTTWSTDGRLAYFCCETTPAGQAYISPDGVGTPALAYEIPGNFIIYAYWSPADCGDNCRELAMLINNTAGLAVDILEDSDTPQTTTAGTGGPFYYHWDSTGTQMIFHRGNRNLDIYSRAQNDVTSSLENSSGLFQAPVWSPVDNRVLIGLEGSSNGLSNLAIIDGDAINIIAEDVPGFVSFLWSPDGEYIAYRTIDQFGYSGITVVNANTGDMIQVADNSDAIGFFWSPDSSKIAYISSGTNTARSANAATRINQTFVQDDSPTRLVWNVLDIEQETLVSYSSFVPTYDFLYLLTYFDQFAPSHRLWSPDSRHLVFAGGLENDQQTPMIYTLDTEAEGEEFATITEGVFGIWSFE